MERSVKNTRRLKEFACNECFHQELKNTQRLKEFACNECFHQELNLKLFNSLQYTEVKVFSPVKLWKHKMKKKKKHPLPLAQKRPQTIRARLETIRANFFFKIIKKKVWRIRIPNANSANWNGTDK